MRRKVVIVGNGIAGLTLSRLLTGKGVDHEVIFRREKSKDFALAETLPPSALPLLQRLGLREIVEEAAVAKTHGYHTSWGSSAISDTNFFFQRPYQYGLKISKQKLARALQLSVTAPISAFDKSLLVERQEGELLMSLDQQGPEAVTFLVDATGRRRAAACQLVDTAGPDDEQLAFSCHLRRLKHPVLKHPVFSESFEHGWGIVSALDGEQNVMTLFTSPETAGLNRFKKYEHWGELLKNSVILKDFLTDENPKIAGFSAGSSMLPATSGSNWLACGDAAMAFDPLSSHGISNAVYTAALAAEAITARINFGDSSKLQEYDRTLREIFNAYMTTRTRIYQSEKRWASSPYWSRQHHGPTSEIGA
jgi:2-polyprenyl-6-methoxyphenol hydroxylase-like FAD-dependent oxidoreductase